MLVGTISIEKSEVVSNELTKAGIKHNVLNAKFHANEAAIVARGGVSGSRDHRDQHGGSWYGYHAGR